jgi:hypothetical protein
MPQTRANRDHQDVDKIVQPRSIHAGIFDFSDNGDQIQCRVLFHPKHLSELEKLVELFPPCLTFFHHSRDF